MLRYGREEKAAASASAAAGPDKRKALETAIAQIERNYGKGAIMRLGDDIPVNVEGHLHRLALPGPSPWASAACHAGA